jgi:NAD(P)-dependent dehydrogenase (short-subunit alcohol dehydrogenase family)
MRLGQPADVTRAVLYLASDEPWWTTGAIVPIDGGVMA